MYLYETHLHTSPVSACSDTRGRDYIARYIDAGYAGIIVTDHFWHGNCGVDRSLPWPEFVNRFCSGFEDALNEGVKRGFPVFFGWEESFQGNDYLIYGLDKQWLLSHPEVIGWDRKTQFEQVHLAGGCVVHAHPFREAFYIPAICLTPTLEDAVEGYNAGNDLSANILGMRYARLTGLPVTAGSDNHHAADTRPDKLAGAAFDQPLACIGDYIRAIRERRPFTPRCPEPVPDWTADVLPNLPVYLLDADERAAQVSAAELLAGRGMPGKTIC